MGKNLKGIVVLLLVLVLFCACGAVSSGSDIKNSAKVDKKVLKRIETAVDDYVVSSSFGLLDVNYESEIIEKPSSDSLFSSTNCYWIQITFDVDKQPSKFVSDSIDYYSRAILSLSKANGFTDKDVKENEVKKYAVIIKCLGKETQMYGYEITTRDGTVISSSEYTELLEKAGIGHFNEYLTKKNG